MTTPEPKPRRPRNAQLARQAILDAAEMVFSQHGFSGARSDAIARAAGYNSSLLFQYFTDKLGLYVAVLRRADEELNARLIQALKPWLSGASDYLDPREFRRFLATLAGTTFDYCVAHPQFMRVLTWEMAEGWQTYVQVATQFAPGEPDRLGRLLLKAQQAGLLRSDFSPMIQVLLVMNLSLPFLASFPIARMVLPGEDFSSPQALAQAREYLVGFVVAGTMADLPNK